MPSPKLPPEITAFIVETKGRSPDISCRKMVRLIEEKYHARVSKSSVARVLRRADLNSPVGRRSGVAVGPVASSREGRAAQKKRPPENWPKPRRRPPSRKRGLGRSVISSKKIESDDNVAVSADDLQEGLPSRPEPSPQEIKTCLPLNDSPSEAVSRNVSGRVRARFQDELVFSPCDRVGLLVFKAAEWALFGRPLMGSLLRRTFPHWQGVDWDSLGEVFLFAPAFGLFSEEDFARYAGQGLWRLNGLSRPVDPGLLYQLKWTEGDIQRMEEWYEIERKQAFQEVAWVEIAREKGPSFYVDSSLGDFFEGMGDAAPLGSLPVCTVVSRVARCLMAGRRPLVLFHCPWSWEDVIRSTAGDRGGGRFWLPVFWDTPGWQAQRFILRDSQGREVTAFDERAGGRRSFLAAVWPWQSQWLSFIQRRRPEAEGSWRAFTWGQEGVFDETTLSLPEGVVSGGGEGARLRMIGLRESRGVFQPFLVILTNLERADWPAEDVIALYAQRWPHQDQGPWGRWARKGFHSYPGDLGMTGGQSESAKAEGVKAVDSEKVKSFFKDRFADRASLPWAGLVQRIWTDLFETSVQWLLTAPGCLSPEMGPFLDRCWHAEEGVVAEDERIVCGRFSKEDFNRSGIQQIGINAVMNEKEIWIRNKSLIIL